MEWVTQEPLKHMYLSNVPYALIPIPQNRYKELMEFINGLDKPQDIVIKQHREKRSLNANAYFHVLVHKIAEAQNIGDEEAKVNLVLEYGAIMRDENGDKVGFKLPASVDVNSIYKYAKWFDKRIENGKEFNCYIIYEQTHKLDSKAMARLIDGTVYVAQNEGITTETPAEIERMKSLWGKEKE
jgi:hypothetical protein